MKKSIFSFLFFALANFGFSQEVLYYCSRPLPAGAGAWQVYLKNLTAATITTITSTPAYNYWWVQLSPDQSQLLMLRSPYTSPTDQFDYVNCEMVKSNADGSNQRVIIADNQYGWYAFGNPHWHPAGNRILMIAQSTNSTQPFYICTVDTNGTNPTLLTSQFSIDANWSPDGNKIVFIGIDSAGFLDATSFEVFIANYNYVSNTLSSIKQLTSDSTRDHDPCFSPDGLKIVFSASDAQITNADLIAINTNGANRTTLLNDAGVHGGPLNWGTDKKIYHHSIYIGSTDFTANDFNTNTTMYETLCASTSHGYISPYYANLNTVGIKTLDEEAPRVTVFPNPFSTETTINSDQNLNNATLRLFDKVGRCVMHLETISGNFILINRNGLPNGLYFLQLVRQDKIVFVSKLVIQD